MRLVQVGELLKRTAVAEGDEDDTVVRERRERVDDGCFLSATWRTRGDKRARKLAYQGAFGPELTSRVPKDLSRGGETARNQIFDHDNGKTTDPTGSTGRTFHCAGKLPYRVGMPKRKASKSFSSSALITG